MEFELNRAVIRTMKKFCLEKLSKTGSDRDDVSNCGRLFHIRAAVTGGTLSSIVEWIVAGMTITAVDTDCCDPVSATRR